MTQLEMALAAQENPWTELLWFDWGYCDNSDDDEWGESDADWLQANGFVDADGNLDIDDLVDFEFE